LLSVLASVIVDVVDRQQQQYALAAARAGPAIMSDYVDLYL
jgi:hypothetical protein